MSFAHAAAAGVGKQAHASVWRTLGVVLLVAPVFERVRLLQLTYCEPLVLGAARMVY